MECGKGGWVNGICSIDGFVKATLFMEARALFHQFERKNSVAWRPEHSQTHLQRDLMFG